MHFFSKEIILTVICLIALVTDLKYRKIFNWLTFPGILLGLLWNCWQQPVLPGLLFGLKGLVLGILIFYIPFSFGGFGAGDIKLLGVIGSFLGLSGTFYTGLFSAIAGGIFSLLMLALRPQLIRTTLTYLKGFILALIYRTPLPEPSKKDYQQRAFPYSIAILSGLILELWLKF